VFRWAFWSIVELRYGPVVLLLVSLVGSKRLRGVCACTHRVSLALPAGALLKAMGDGDAAAVARLLAVGADVDVADSASRTALYLASKHGHLAVVEELLEAKAHHHRRSKKAMVIKNPLYP
jgi:hypothetical protein